MGMGNTAKRVFGGLGGAVLLSAALAVPAFAEEGVTTMATTAPLNLRAGAGMGYSVVDVVPENTSVQVFGMTSDGWYDVEYNGERGCCWYKYLDFEGQADGTVHDGHVTDMYATAPLHVRAQPNTSSEVIDVLPEGQYVPVISKHDGWFKVSYNGQEGYCYGEYLDFGQTGADECRAGSTQGDLDNTMANLVTTAPLYVRTQPSPDAQIIGAFDQGETVKTLGMEGSWYKVEYDGQTGYSYGGYLQ